MGAALSAREPSPAFVGTDRMAAAGLRAFSRIADAWGLSVDEQLRLLGSPPRSTFFSWRIASRMTPKVSSAKSPSGAR